MMMRICNKCFKTEMKKLQLKKKNKDNYAFSKKFSEFIIIILSFSS